MAEEPRNVRRIFQEGTLIDQALKRAARAALEVHKRAGLPLAIWRDGKTCWVSPEEFEKLLSPPTLSPS
jgi:hypothetical protein